VKIYDNKRKHLSVGAVEGLGLKGPFTVTNPISFTQGPVDANTRISIFVFDLFLLPGETAHDVKVKLVDHDNQTFEFDPYDSLWQWEHATKQYDFYGMQSGS
jgi:hypothetical protein